METKTIQIDDDLLEITPLGGGCEVGRSCIFLKFKNKQILLDCGIHPSDNDLSSLPYFDKINPEEIDLLLITHFHLDHCGSVPYFLEKTGFKGETYMTYPTKAIYKHVLLDSLTVGMSSDSGTLFNRDDVLKSMDKIKAINFHEQHTCKGIKFVAYNAGHVVGAAMFLIEIAGIRILYTGDYSREEDLHIRPAEIPKVEIDVLIVESTYGIKTHESREMREKLFLETVEKIIKRKGKCLLPVFVLGRAQELLLLLEQNWGRKEDLQQTKIYYASTLMAKCMLIFQTYVNMMGKSIKEKMKKGTNPFDFKYISVMENVNTKMHENEPMVVMASPGMLQKGLSRTLFQHWCHDERNGVLFTGYCVENTFAKDLLNGKKEFKKDNDQVSQIKMSVEYISFSAHADYNQTREFIETVKPKLVVLVHGEKHEANRLKDKLEEYFGNKVRFEAPNNWQSVDIKVPYKEKCKVVGDLAVDLKEKMEEAKRRNDETGINLESEDFLIEIDYEAILLRKNLKYFLVKGNEMGNFVKEKMCKIDQKLHIKYSHSIDFIFFIIRQVMPQTIRTKRNDRDCIIVKETIFIYKINEDELVLEWTSSERNDIIGDCFAYLIHNMAAYEKIDIFSESHENVGDGYNNEQVLLNALQQNFEKGEVENNDRFIIIKEEDGTELAKIEKEGRKIINSKNDYVTKKIKNLINLIY